MSASLFPTHDFSKERLFIALKNMRLKPFNKIGHLSSENTPVHTVRNNMKTTISIENIFIW